MPNPVPGRAAHALWSAAVVLAAIAPHSASPAAAPGEPDSAIVGLDLQGDRARLDAMARLLLADDPGTWRQAQARLANAGPRALDAIDRAHVLRDPRGRERIRQLLPAALRLSVAPRDLFGHDSLAALVRAPIARGYTIAETLAARKYIWCQGHCGSVKALFDHGELPPPTAFDRMTQLGGCAVAAAAAMLRDSRPVARAYGLMILAAVGAVSVSDSIRPLAGDAAAVGEDQGDVSTRTTVGAKALAALEAFREAQEASYALESRAIAILRETGDASLLVDGLRTSSRELAARSWDEWWREAEPAWNEWWRLSADGSAPRDAVAWQDFIDGLDGCHIRRGTSSDGRARVSITGPPGTSCRVTLVTYPDSTLIASGRVPIVLESPARRDSARSGPATIGTPGALRIAATLPEGRVWSRMYVWESDSEIRVELLATARRER